MGEPGTGIDGFTGSVYSQAIIRHNWPISNVPQINSFGKKDFDWYDDSHDIESLLSRPFAQG